MARGVRLDSPGSIHHVMSHAIRDELLFHSNKTRVAFLSRLGSAFEVTGCTILAWALMGSHFHLLVRTGNKPLHRFMHLLLTGYSVWLNHSTARSGHLFQGRYHSILVDSESYLQEAVRYIHLNPLRAGYVRDVDQLKDFSWSGHAAIITGDYPPWQDIASVRAMFGSSEEEAVADYVAFMRSGAGLLEYSPAASLVLDGAGLHGRDPSRGSLEHDSSREHLAGSFEFGRRVIAEIDDAFRDRFRGRSIRREDIEAVFIEIERRWGITRKVLLGRSRPGPVSAARSYGAWRLTNELGLSLVAAGRLLHLTGNGTWKAASRWANLTEAERMGCTTTPMTQDNHGEGAGESSSQTLCEQRLAQEVDEVSYDPEGSSPEKKTR
jgi:putative transposase